jgi:hypothetical protein
MTPIGHTLTGLTIGCIVLPSNFSVRSKTITLAVFALLANLPDLPLPGWGHTRYDISHSLVATTVGIVVLGMIASVTMKGRGILSPALLVGGGLAWYSHLLLDSFYSHRQGIAIFWPFSSACFALPIPCFESMEVHPLFCLHNFRVFAIEAAVYGTILGLTLAIRRFMVSPCPRV